MNLPSPNAGYDQNNEAQTRAAIAREDRNNRKRGDLEVTIDERFIMTSPNGSRWVMGVSNAGATTWTAL